MGVLIIIAVVVAFIMLTKSGMSSEIQRSGSIKDIVMAVNFGKIHPYNTGMSLNEVRSIVHRLHSNTSDFDNTIDMYMLTGRVPSIDLPSMANTHIERVSLGFNSNNIVSSISITFKNIQSDKAEIVRELTSKFGSPQFRSEDFTAWKRQRLTISLHKSGMLDVWDDRYMNC